ncbi:hypothetical protein QLL95_gp0532 [Cotonvirus japonicus]|uniref:Zeta toxin domain-containing protein n=1 Tax=Cotonvirus japonicus TaxID=2811091 RepID=A0ABM7NU51_9VIRU|nr:hypothetical protein QLL95_gp0532 [Cotonvirus japonicus]BCS83591.1 hypothetical protein [Cotonvirus japonicus]
MSDKFNKYIQKINTEAKPIYLKKIVRHLDETKHFPSQVGGLKLNNFDSLVEFLRQSYERASSETNKKYLVILYGPPASGKSISRYVASYMIKDLFAESIPVEEIYKSFIDTGIDEITYETETSSNKRIIDLLKENTNEKLGNDKTIDNAKKNIAELALSSWNIYKTNRPDYVSEMLYYFAIYLNKNIFIETTGSSTDYLKRIINLLSFYNYVPILIYPFINDVKIVYNRSIQRGLKEGRFLRCDTPFGLASQMKISLANYPKMKEIISKYNNYLIYQYNSNFSSEIAQQLTRFDFSNLDDYTMELKYNIQNVNDRTTTNRVIDVKNNNYNNLVQMNLDCE